MVKQNIKEKRKSTRANVISYVIIRCDIRVNTGNKEEREFHTHTENICEGGINVILDEKLNKPDNVEVKLYLTGRLKPIECTGQIAWSKKITGPAGIRPGIFSTGIKLIKLSANDREAIAKVVSCFK